MNREWKRNINERSSRNRWACQVPECTKVVEAFDATVAGNAIVDHIAEVHGNLVREPLEQY